MNVQSIIFYVYAAYAFKKLYSINLQAWVLFEERVRAIVFDECETVVSMDRHLKGNVYYRKFHHQKSKSHRGEVFLLARPKRG